MKNWKEAQALLQKAYDLDVGEANGGMTLPKDLLAVGVMAVHKVWYDGGLFTHPELQELLSDKPEGSFASLIRCLVEQRVERGEYKEETLIKMYGLR